MNPSSNSTDISADELTALAEAHGVKPDYDLQNALYCAYKLYTVIFEASINWKEAGKQKTQLEKLANKAKKLVKAIDEFNDAKSGFDSLSKNPAVKPNGVVRLRRDVERQKEQVRLDAKNWGRDAELVLKSFGELKRGPSGDPAFNSLLKLLITVYEDATGKKAGISFNDNKYSGPLFRFVEAVLYLLSMEKMVNSALGRAIRKQLEKGKASAEQPSP